MPNSSRKALLIALLVSGAFFMEMLDGTIIATALPQMAHTFQLRAVDLSIGMSAYLLTLAVFIPMSGWVADRFGARLVFGLAIAIFTGASVLCGFCSSLGSFTAARILQGVGGSMMVPVGQLVVLRSSEKRDLMRSIAYITWPGLAAPIIAPAVGGYITDHFTWRWIFFLNLPLGLMALSLVPILIPPGLVGERRPFDAVGFITCGLSFVSLLVGLSWIGGTSAETKDGVKMLFFSAFVGTVGIRYLLSVDNPLIRLDLLRVRTFLLTMRGGSLFRISIQAIPFLMPLMFQVGFGMSAEQSGFLVLAIFAGNLVMKPGTVYVLRRFGFRNVLVVNGMLNALWIFSYAFLEPTTPKWMTLVLLFCGGLSRSMQFTAINTVAFIDIPEGKKSDASTLFSMFGQLSIALGIALGAVALRIATLVVPSGLGHSGPADFHLAFLAIGVLTVASLFDCFSLSATAGQDVSGHVAKARP
jgi:EmrB/QacA subfamily drug resistance transporter